METNFTKEIQSYNRIINCYKKGSLKYREYCNLKFEFIKNYGNYEK